LEPAIFAYTAVKLSHYSFSDSQSNNDLTSGSAFSSSALARQLSETEPRLVVRDSRGIAGEPLPLGARMEGWVEGAVVVITGIIPGMTLSTGRPGAANTWQVPAPDLANTWIGPPVGFVGVANLTAELRLDDGATLTEPQPLRINWIGTSPTAEAPNPPTAPLAREIPATRQLKQDEITRQANQTIEHKAARTRHNAARSKTTALIPRKGAIASVHRRAAKRRTSALPTQLTRGSFPGW